jgi:hypothetical protein
MDVTDDNNLPPLCDPMFAIYYDNDDLSDLLPLLDDNDADSDDENYDDDIYSFDINEDVYTFDI